MYYWKIFSDFKSPPWKNVVDLSYDELFIMASSFALELSICNGISLQFSNEVYICCLMIMTFPFPPMRNLSNSLTLVNFDSLSLFIVDCSLPHINDCWSSDQTGRYFPLIHQDLILKKYWSSNLWLFFGRI